MEGTGGESPHRYSAVSGGVFKERNRLERTGDHDLAGRVEVRDFEPRIRSRAERFHVLVRRRHGRHAAGARLTGKVQQVSAFQAQRHQQTLVEKSRSAQGRQLSVAVTRVKAGPHAVGLEAQACRGLDQAEGGLGVTRVAKPRVGLLTRCGVNQGEERCVRAQALHGVDALKVAVEVGSSADRNPLSMLTAWLPWPG